MKPVADVYQQIKGGLSLEFDARVLSETIDQRLKRSSQRFIFVDQGRRLIGIVRDRIRRLQAVDLGQCANQAAQ